MNKSLKKSLYAIIFGVAIVVAYAVASMGAMDGAMRNLALTNNQSNDLSVASSEASSRARAYSFVMNDLYSDIALRRSSPSSHNFVRRDLALRHHHFTTYQLSNINYEAPRLVQNDIYALGSTSLDLYHAIISHSYIYSIHKIRV
ncbi:MAG: hypothetical protein RSF93_06705 [Mucinivorans sp.]